MPTAVAVILWVSLSAGSQTARPEGRVVDARTDRAVAGASVTIAGARTSALTDAEGRFRWPDAPAGTMVVVVILPDGRAARPVTIAAGEDRRGRVLRIETVYGESVTVSGAAPDIDVAAGASSTVILEADLGLRRPSSLAQAIELLPGVSRISQGQDVTPVIRSLARGRTLILIDGARVVTERGAGPSASFLDPAGLSRIDVARGPGSVAYGTDAIGGVIAARSRRPIAAGGFSARASATAATGQPEQRGDVELGYGYRTGGILVAARAREFEDYSSPEGVVPFSGWRDAGARLVWTQSLKANHLTLGWQRDDARDIGRPRSDSSTMVASGPFERSTRVTLAFERASLGRWRDLRVDGFFGTSELRSEQDRLPAPGRPRRIDRADGSARDLQARLTGRRSIAAVDVHAGVDLQRRFDVAATDTAIVFNAAGAVTGTTVTNTMASANRTALGAFAEGEIRLTPWMRASGGVRVDGTRSENSGGFFGDRITRRTAVAGAGALTIAPARSTAVTFQVARAFREPTLTDRFSRGPVGRGFLEGNPDLVPETSRQYDATIRHTAGRVQITGAAYRYDISDLIERYTAGVDLFRMRNRGRARLTGVEVEARVDAGHGLTVDLIAQRSRGRDTSDGTPLDDVAPRSIGLVARHVWRARVSSYLRFSAIADHDRAGPSEVPTPGHTLLDAAAGWRITRMLEVRASGRNLLGASFYSSSGPRWVWAPGRQASVTVVVSAKR